MLVFRWTQPFLMYLAIFTLLVLSSLFLSILCLHRQSDFAVLLFFFFCWFSPVILYFFVIAFFLFLGPADVLPSLFLVTFSLNGFRLDSFSFLTMILYFIETPHPPGPVGSLPDGLFFSEAMSTLGHIYLEFFLPAYLP